MQHTTQPDQQGTIILNALLLYDICFSSRVAEKNKQARRASSGQRAVHRELKLVTRAKRCCAWKQRMLLSSATLDDSQTSTQARRATIKRETKKSAKAVFMAHRDMPPLGIYQQPV